jgi:hypothetical protein
MPKIGRINVWSRLVLALCWLAATTIHATNDTSTTVTSSTSRASGSSSLLLLPTTSTTTTCPARTINYITHTLPQQCLRASRATLINSTAATATDQVQPTSNSTAGVASTAPETHSTLNPTGTLTVNENLSTHHVLTASQTQGIEPPISSLQSSSLLQSDIEETPSLVSATQSPVAPAEPELESDSPLDDSKFLSFEEWKKQNLAKVGQSPENVGQGRATPGEGRQRPVINNALDSLGDEGEIELNFAGFGGGDGSASRWTAEFESSQTSVDNPSSTDSLAPNARPKSKDAGKTCKERFNYASFDCAATILKTNPKCKSASSVLVENKDSYLLNECSTSNKHLIVELCDDILVDTVVLANFEFFSSMFRTFTVSVSDRYPVKADRWKDLGTFEARNSREIQAFLVQNPLIWARYLKIEFLTHYGGEFYCPVSLIRVHGTTMMEEFRHQEDTVRGEDDVDGEVVEPAGQELPTQQPQTIEDAPKPQPVVVEKETPSEAAEVISSTPPTSPLSLINIIDTGIEATYTEANDSILTTTPIMSLPASSHVTQADVTSLPINVTATSLVVEKVQTLSVPTSSAAGEKPVSPTQEPSKQTQVSEKSLQTPSSVSAPAQSSSSSLEQQPPPHSSSQVNSKVEVKPVQATSDAARPPTPVSQQQPPTPTTQESFFKSVHKRLLMLEVNSTLSLQYIEEQSRILRDAFMQVEKRQLNKTEKFLDHLNDTVMTELKGFRQQYDQLWQSTVIELETHREQHQQEMFAISSRLTLMADELVFQKRMIVVQSTLLLLCLGLVIFVRSGSSYLELPLLQTLTSKSHNMLKLSFESPPGSPLPRNSSPASRKKRRLVRYSSGTSDSLGSPSPERHAGNPSLEFSPPTPSDGGRSERGRSPSLDDPEPPAHVRQTKSGPATPSGRRENENALEWIGARSGSGTESPTPSQGNKLSAGDRQRSPLRYSGGSEFDGVEETDMADMQDPAVARLGRSIPLQRTAVSIGSSDDGDTVADLLIADGMSD